MNLYNCTDFKFGVWTTVRRARTTDYPVTLVVTFAAGMPVSLFFRSRADCDGYVSDTGLAGHIDNDVCTGYMMYDDGFMCEQYTKDTGYGVVLG